MSVSTMEIDFTAPEPAAAPMPESFTLGKKYFRVYIRMRTATYTVRRGLSFPTFVSDDAKLEWESICRTIAENCCLEYSKGFWYHPSDPATRVHFHPDHISGEMAPELISELQSEVIAYSGLLRYETTELYDRVGDLVGKDEVDRRFAHYRDEIETAVLKACATRSTRKYAHVDFPLMVQRFPGLTLAFAFTGFCPRRHLTKCCEQVQQDLVDRGLLIKHPSIDGYYRKILPREIKAQSKEGG